MYGSYRCIGPVKGPVRERDEGRTGTDLVPDDKGTHEHERDGSEEDDGRDNPDGFEHLQRG